MDHHYAQLSHGQNNLGSNNSTFDETSLVGAHGNYTSDCPAASWSETVSPISDSTAQRSKQHPRATDHTRSRSSTSHNSIRHTQILGNWWVEIGACFLSLVALFTIVATLYPHQDKPLPQWPYHISVNSLIAIYVVILKAMILLVIAEGLSQLKWRRFAQDRPLDDLLRYDEASQGPWGAVRLLWRLRLQHPLSSIGAFITLFVLLTDPTTQQIIRFYDCNVFIDGSTASIPRTNFYSYEARHAGAGVETIEPSLETAINAGIFSPGQSVTTKCDSGNCTFPDEYHTFGYCSSCIDTSDQLSVQNSTDHLGGRMTTISTPSNMTVYLSELYELPSKVMAMTTDGVATIDILRGPSQQAECGDRYMTEDWSCGGYGAASCTLSPCVRTSKAAISAGNFEESLVFQTGSQPFGYLENSDSAPWWTTIIDTRCISSKERENLLSAGYKIPSSTPWLPYNISFDPTSRPPSDAPFPQSMLVHQCVYGIDQIFKNSLW